MREGKNVGDEATKVEAVRAIWKELKGHWAFFSVKKRSFWKF